LPRTILSSDRTNAPSASLAVAFMVNTPPPANQRRSPSPSPRTIGTIVSTLVIAALFNPLRGRTQALIEQRSFYRRKYDAAKTLEAYSAKLREETDLDALCEDLRSAVIETMQLSHLSLWLHPDTAAKEDVRG
jgi:hypothetical protein